MTTPNSDKATFCLPDIHLSGYLKNADSHSPAIVKKKKKQGDLFPLLLQRFPDILESGDEIIQNFRGNHDPVPVGTHLFRNTHHFAARILFEIKKERLAFRNDFFLYK